MTSKILVVDDEPDLEALMLQKFRRQIRAKQFEFFFAHNGFEALEQLRRQEDIDLVLTDINMPEMDGLTLLSELTAFGPQLKAVVVSAYGDLANIRTAMNRGAFDFLTKPIDFTDLEVTIAKTLEQVSILKQAHKAKNQLHAIEEELELAGALQQSILPCNFPTRADHELFARMIPAKDVGGDFYDFFYIDDKRLGVVMADVSGKGVMAAMFMAVSRTLLRFTALQGMEVGPCLAHVNNLLCADNESSMFVTTFYGILELPTRTFTYANAGHNPPFRVTAAGEVTPLPATNGIALGVVEGVEYASERLALAADDTILLYTDGITEATNGGGELYTETRALRFLEAAGSAPPREMIDALVNDVVAFTGEAPQADDMTLLALRVR